MILNYENFKQCLNSNLFENSYSDLIKKIAENSERYVGLFRPTKPKTKLIQNITQSHEIRFGDALESIFERYFEAIGFNLHTKRIFLQDKELNIDQLFSKNHTLYMIEQKVRDDHDSTKKVGQFNNFENKYYALTLKYKEFEIIPIMWFIDDSLTKNRNYYLQEMLKLQNDYACTPYLFYGKQMFQSNLADFDIEMWNETLLYLEQWKNGLPDMPEINFDKNAATVFNEIKNLAPTTYRKLFTNEDIIKQIFPIIFPEKKVLLLLFDYFKQQEGQIYRTLSRYLQDLLK